MIMQFTCASLPTFGSGKGKVPHISQQAPERDVQCEVLMDTNTSNIYPRWTKVRILSNRRSGLFPQESFGKSVICESKNQVSLGPKG